MSSSFKENFAPTIVLVVICLVASLLLATTFQVTKPQIEFITQQRADAARALVFGGFDENGAPNNTFEEVAVSENQLVGGVQEVYRATDGSGGVITAVNKGFGGGVTVMTGIDSEGKITGVTITEHAETPGLGTKAMAPAYLDQFQGQDEITNVDGGSGVQIDSVTGATYSSNAIFNSVQDALGQYAELGGAF